MTTKIQSSAAHLQSRIFVEEYYPHLYTAALKKHKLDAELVRSFGVDDDKLISLCNTFWDYLPDNPCIRTGPFWDLCNICESY